MKILNVVGARPNLVKIAPMLEAIKRHPRLESILLHTGQHYNYELYKIFFKDLNLPRPDINLGIGSDAYPRQIARIMSAFYKALKELLPDLVVVFGDVNSTLACALVAAQEKVPLAHVEAGLRSFDRRMLEETNRIITDSVSDYLFTSCQDANDNLIKEGIDKRKIFFVGNIMIDTLLKYKNRAAASNILSRLKVKNQRFAVLTLHRPENVDDRRSFKGILAALKIISRRIKIIYPLHPRAKRQLESFGLNRILSAMKNMQLIRPLGYLDFLKLQTQAQFILTDSGGIQEEATILNIPCLTLRENTERPITVAVGTNIVVGTKPEKIVVEAEKILSGRVKIGSLPSLWDGKTAERIAKILFEDKHLK